MLNVAVSQIFKTPHNPGNRRTLKGDVALFILAKVL